MIFNIKAKYTFTGTFEIEADSQEEAERIVNEDCGMTLSGGIHSTRDDVDWNFPRHPEKSIQSGE